MYGDFDNSHPKALDALAEALKCPISHTSDEGDGGHEMPSLNQHSTVPILAHVPKNGGYFETNQRFSPQPLVMTSTPTSPPNPIIEKNFELCVNVGEHNISLAEIGISTPESRITTDGELFREIKMHYMKCRGFLRTHTLYLFKPVKVNFVQVNMV